MKLNSNDIRFVDPDIFDDDLLGNDEINMEFKDRWIFKQKVKQYRDNKKRFEKIFDEMEMKQKYYKKFENYGIGTLWSFNYNIRSLEDVKKIIKNENDAMIIWKKMTMFVQLEHENEDIYKQDHVRFEKLFDEMGMKKKYYKKFINYGIATFWSFNFSIKSVNDVERITKNKRDAVVIWRKIIAAQSSMLHPGIVQMEGASHQSASFQRFDSEDLYGNMEKDGDGDGDGDMNGGTWTTPKDNDLESIVESNTKSKSVDAFI